MNASTQRTLGTLRKLGALLMTFTLGACTGAVGELIKGSGEDDAAASEAAATGEDATTASPKLTQLSKCPGAVDDAFSTEPAKLHFPGGFGWRGFSYEAAPPIEIDVLANDKPSGAFTIVPSGLKFDVDVDYGPGGEPGTLEIIGNGRFRYTPPHLAVTNTGSAETVRYPGGKGQGTGTSSYGFKDSFTYEMKDASGCVTIGTVVIQNEIEVTGTDAIADPPVEAQGDGAARN